LDCRQYRIYENYLSTLQWQAFAIGKTLNGYQENFKKHLLFNTVHSERSEESKSGFDFQDSHAGDLNQVK